MWKESCIRTFCGCRGSCVKSSCLKWCHLIQCQLRLKTSLKMKKKIIVWVWIFSIPYNLVFLWFLSQSPAQYSQIEQDALKLAQEIRAEYWAVSSLTGESVDLNTVKWPVTPPHFKSTTFLLQLPSLYSNIITEPQSNYVLFHIELQRVSTRNVMWKPKMLWKCWENIL